MTKFIYLLSFFILAMNSFANSQGSELFDLILAKSTELKEELGADLERFMNEDSNLFISKIKQSGSSQRIKGVKDENFDAFLKLFLRTVEESRRGEIEKYLKEIKLDTTGDWKELSFMFRDTNKNKIEFTQIFGNHEKGKTNFQVTRVSSEIEVTDGENMFVLESDGKNKETSIVGEKYSEKFGVGLFNFMKKKAYDTFLQENSKEKKDM